MTTATAPAFTIADLKAFYTRADVRVATAALRLAMKEAPVVRAKVNAYIVPLLAVHNIRRPTGEAIVDPGKVYLCKDEAACAAYFAACDVAHKQHGYDLEPGYCPASIAEYAVTQAENALLKLAAGLYEGFARVYGKQRDELLALLLNPPRA